ncbi:LysR family transcriptional regulator [Fictibacillus terranigra]|uniref:LysR family transcriptional regulator n=1 Tax=Fictibacillus terranigra TaxID=3058424 RepID=A0ABT8EC83_9BACL|nr:LysR family transcriptional regulator [Fictibacillus sp. CENA-BCM004]MDN4075442.1 LysR family transcriptional regulator [Fictibacillus sp. CENA-BCM004]
MDIPINLHQLQLFCCVVEHGSYSQAAKSLIMTQPALSIQVKSLEKKLGAKLFVRKGNKIELTEAGKLVNQYASSLLSLDKQLRSSVGELISGESGQIVIGSNRPIGRYLLPNYILKFMQRYPTVELTTTYDNTDQICRYVLDEKVNVGFVTWSKEQKHATSSKIIKHLIGKDHWILVCAAGSPWATWRGSIQDVLRKAPLIGSLPKTTHGEIINREMHRLGLDSNDYRFSLRLDDIESIKMAVISQLGIAFLPQTTIERELSNKELVPVPLTTEYKLYLDYYLVLKEGTYITPTLNNFIKFILEINDVTEGKREIKRETV